MHSKHIGYLQKDAKEIEQKEQRTLSEKLGKKLKIFIDKENQYKVYYISDRQLSVLNLI